MAGVALTTSLMVQTSRTLCARSSFYSRVFHPASRKHVQVRSMACEPSDAAKRGLDEMKKATENIANQSKEAAGNVVGAAENITEKAKQTAQDALKNAKEAAEKVKENVPQKADEVANAVKENIDIAKRKMSKD